MGFRDFAKHLKKCRKYTSSKKNERNMHHGCHQQCNAMLTFNVWSTNAGRGFFKPIANEKMQVKPNLKYMFFFSEIEAQDSTAVSVTAASRASTAQSSRNLSQQLGKSPSSMEVEDGLMKKSSIHY
jgi:hypothetical protein